MLKSNYVSFPQIILDKSGDFVHNIIAMRDMISINCEEKLWENHQQ